MVAVCVRVGGHKAKVKLAHTRVFSSLKLFLKRHDGLMHLFSDRTVKSAKSTPEGRHTHTHTHALGGGLERRKRAGKWETARKNEIKRSD